MGSTAKRSTTRRDAHRRAVRRRGETTCHICLDEIDFNEPYLSPREFVIDHVIPLARGGDDALHNIRAAHRRRLQPREVRPTRVRG